MRKDLFTRIFKIEGTLGLYQALRLCETAAVEHAEVMGLGFEEMVRTKAFWVLTRQKLIINQWPINASVKVVTWSRPLKGMSATRDFELFVDDVKIAECSTRWLVLDLTTRRPTQPTIDLTKTITRSDYNLNFDAEKIESINDATEVMRYKVQKTDLDLNNHVTNTKYTEWVLKAANEGFKESLIKEYDINFIAETHLDQIVIIQSKKYSDHQFLFQGLRESDQHILFTALVALH